MNTSKKTIHQLLKNTAFLSLVILILASCRKDSNTSANSGNSSLTLVHASPGTIAYDVRLNGLRLNPNVFTYGNYYNYGLVPSGNAVFSITYARTNMVAARDSFSLKPYTTYSLYITDIPSKSQFASNKRRSLLAPASG